MRRQKFAVPRRNYSRLRRWNWVLWVILFVVIGVVCTGVAYFNALQFSFIDYLLYGTGGLLIIGVAVLMILKQSKWVVFLCNSIGLLVFGTLLFRGFRVISTYNQLQQSQSPMIQTMSVLVLKNSSIAAIQQIGTENIAAPMQQDNEQITILLNDIKTNMNLKMSVQSVNSYIEGYQALTSNTVRGIVMNSAYASLLEKVAPEYSATVKSVYNFNVPTVSRQTPNEQSPTFNVLVSAVDSHLPITSLGRSDISMLLSANTTKKQVLLTQTPVSAYVPIYGTPGQQWDQIANDFMYGVDHALETSSALYGTPVDYYVRIHLQEMAELIDQLGGITVDNTTEFTTSYGGYTFHVGPVHLNAQQALGYMREAVVVDGASLREKHQLAVLSAIFQKLASFEVLMNSDAYMTQLQDAIQTNLPFKRLMILVNTLVDSKKVSMQSLKVTVHPNVPSQALPGVTMPMGQVDDTSLNAIKQAIQELMR